LEDFCNILGAGHHLLPHKRQFMRNVFTESVGDLGQCENPSVGFEIRAEECEDIVVLLGDSSALLGESSGIDNAKPLPFVLLFFISFISSIL
jgi:hypothetical protein